MKTPTPIVAAAPAVYASQKQFVEALDKECLALERNEKASLKQKIRVGKMLLYAKERLPYGEWSAFLKRDFRFSRMTAFRLMKLAGEKQETEAEKLSFEEAVEESKNVQLYQPVTTENDETANEPTTSGNNGTGESHNNESTESNETGTTESPPPDPPPPAPAGSATAADTGGEPGPTGEESQEPEPPRDRAGHVIPDALREAFGVLDYFQELDSAARQLQKGIDAAARAPGGEHLRRFVRPVGSDEKVKFKSEHLDELKRDLRFARPYSVCPFCAGVGCGKCADLGWVSELTWKDIADDVKARLV